jgi:MFS transporter, DHA2 family, multidrug resistance protein
VIAPPCLFYSMDLRHFRAAAFRASLTAFLLSIFVMARMIFFITQYLQLVLGLSLLEAGLWTLKSASGLIAGGRPGRPPL